jgi:4'-phosphopantetheinyl transferase
MEIYVIDTTNFNNLSLSSLKKFKKKEIKNQKTLRIHCLTYFLLDDILKKIYGINNRQICFVDNKPVLLTNEINFSISHSENFISLAFSGYNCGIDIEKIKDRDYISIAKTMKFDVKNQKDFYKEWTKYEALYKLGTPKKNYSSKSFDIEGFILTAVCENVLEDFIIKKIP